MIVDSTTRRMEEGQVLMNDESLKGFLCPDTFVTFSSEADLKRYHSQSRVYELMKRLNQILLGRKMKPQNVRSLFTPVSLVYEYAQRHKPPVKVVESYTMEEKFSVCTLTLEDKSSRRILYVNSGKSTAKKEAKTCAAVAMFDTILSKDTKAGEHFRKRALTMPIKPSQMVRFDAEKVEKTEKVVVVPEKKKEPKATAPIDNEALSGLLATLQQQSANPRNSLQVQPLAQEQLHVTNYQQASTSSYTPVFDTNAMLKLQEMLQNQQLPMPSSSIPPHLPEQQDTLEETAQAKRQRIDDPSTTIARHLQHIQAPSPRDPRRGIIF